MYSLYVFRVVYGINIVTLILDLLNSSFNKNKIQIHAYHERKINFLYLITGPFTLIVPTNEAFAKLPPATVASLQKDSSALANVLQYHVVKGSIYSWDMVSGEILSSLNGHYIRVYSQGSVSFNIK